MSLVYSQESQKLILDKLHGKGWNAYKSTDAGRVGADETIRSCYAEQLELNERYVVLPKADNPRDPAQVFGALERLAIKLNRQTPTIHAIDRRYPWTGFRLGADDVKLNADSSHELRLPYAAFMEALDSIVNTGA